MVYIGLGANLADPQVQLKNAVQMIAKIPDSEVVCLSSFYGSKPMGPQDQPDYINAVCAIETSLPPLSLLDALQLIELNAGRVRKTQRWGARTLDLDILLYGHQTMNNERLTVPHYGLKEREFVLYPLTEIAPELILPCGSSVKELTKKIAANGITVIEKTSLSDMLN